jgi:hypothetical protein
VGERTRLDLRKTRLVLRRDDEPQEHPRLCRDASSGSIRRRVRLREPGPWSGYFGAERRLRAVETRFAEDEPVLVVEDA